jgi:hypothetical protein
LKKTGVYVNITIEMSYEISYEIAHADRAWHDLETQLAEDEAAATGKPVERFTDIVDVDVLPRDDNPIAFHDRDEVRDAYSNFLRDPRLKASPSEEFIRGRLLGQLLHLELLEGTEVDVHSHIETAMGSELVLIDEGKIDDRQQEIEDQLSRHGLGFDKAYAEEFEAKLGIARNRQALRRHIISFARRTGLLAVGEKPGSSLVIPTIVEKDAGWVGYFSTDNKTGKPFSELNAHPRHGYTRGRAAAVAVHEGTGHAADFEHKYQAIRRGEMDPIFGITVPQTRENVTAETIALGREQQVLRRVQGRNAWEYHVQGDYHDYLEMVWNNALIRINSGEDEDKLVKYMTARLLPYEKEESTVGRLQDMRDDPTWRANSGAYEPGMRIVRRVMQLTDREQEKFFREIGKYPYTEAQMHQIFEGESVERLAA